MNKTTSLYRKYRPSKFTDVVEQVHVTRTLQNQIANGTVSHAYLFCGTRGTGKTSIAKIFARSVGAELDIFEIDAASNNSVDDVRELTEKTKYPPTFGQYKVYIIDEVHMFSQSAFNAFLKTLEEPPAHVIFILCTTEPHKLPQTILSRVLRFDFRAVTANSMSKYLKSIFAKEKIQATPQSIEMIARAGQGSVRDMLSIAEAVMAFSGNITEADVETVLGTAGGDKVRSLINAITDKKVDGVAGTCKKIFDGGINTNALVRDVLRELKSMFLETKNKRYMEIYRAFAEIELLIKTATDPQSMFEGVALMETTK